MITPRLNDLVALLRETGIRADIDPRNLQPPCAWVAAKRIPDWTMCQPEITADIVLIAPDNGVPHALDALENMLTSVVDTLATEGHPISDVSLSDTVTLSGIGSPLPAFTIETTI
ncbi:hypothetical protein GP475_09680 [Corynebacterium poyangense]|uniref:Uncharacterized protein n=1 Tax=Corynebacterium poyangense TaxID=2684405 RepID=A0A7H0SQQ4_9CORY|nr:hypothetical protein [Corynebacterium poyangense]QNQ90879.1 hypothetical protein GP475_09680 [Corynebacterium poyangense]